MIANSYRVGHLGHPVDQPIRRQILKHLANLRKQTGNKRRQIDEVCP